MQNCESCNHRFNYKTMCLAKRHVVCPDCDSKYKVEAKSILLLLLFISFPTGILFYIYSFAPTIILWVVGIVQLVLIFILAPFNQKLELVEKEIEEELEVNEQ